VPISTYSSIVLQILVLGVASTSQDKYYRLGERRSLARNLSIAHLLDLGIKVQVRLDVDRMAGRRRRARADIHDRIDNASDKVLFGGRAKSIDATLHEREHVGDRADALVVAQKRC